MGRRVTPTSARHIVLAELNEQSFDHLIKQGLPMFHWAGTALFYSALHYTDALLLVAGEPAAANHDERWRQMDRQVDNDFIAHYAALKDLSEDWRYYGTERDATYINMARAGHHAPIKSAARNVVKGKP